MMFYDPSSKGEKYIPQTYIVGGFFSNENVWENIEQRWKAENNRVGVTRFHATHVNARSGEFEGWSKEKQIEYSKNLIQILRDQGRDLHALSCGIWASDYYRIINEYGRRKMGHPYISCFNSCVALIAQEMEVRNFPPEHKFAVIMDRNQFENEAVESFYKMKDSTDWTLGCRMATCAPGSTEDFTPLECADLIAYETFRLVHDKSTGDSVRKALSLMFSTNGFLGHALDTDALRSLKEPLENAVCADNSFVVRHAPLPFDNPTE
jgi:hypothetical protein